MIAERGAKEGYSNAVGCRLDGRLDINHEQIPKNWYGQCRGPLFFEVSKPCARRRLTLVPIKDEARRKYFAAAI